MIREIKEAAKAGDSLGGVVEVLGFGMPPGLGSHVHWDRRIDGLLAQALMSIQAMKAVEIGDGFTVAAGRGSVAHDAIAWDADARRVRPRVDAGRRDRRRHDHRRPARRARRDEAARDAEPAGAEDGRHGDQGGAVSFKERTDVTAVPAGEWSRRRWALVLASEALRKFGGDSVTEFVRNHDAYRASLR